MDTTPAHDAVTLLAALDADAIRERLDAIDSERRALLVLLRSLRARERSDRRSQTTPDGTDDR